MTLILGLSSRWCRERVHRVSGPEPREKRRGRENCQMQCSQASRRCLRGQSRQRLADVNCSPLSRFSCSFAGCWMGFYTFPCPLDNAVRTLGCRPSFLSIPGHKQGVWGSPQTRYQLNLQQCFTQHCRARQCVSVQDLFVLNPS